MNFEQLHRRAKILREQYPPGSRLELIRMDDPYSPVESGTKGSVIAVDDACNILMNWDNGRMLSLVPEADQFRALTQEEIKAEQQTQIVVRTISLDELSKISDEEGLIIQGCGGDLTEWVDGINQMLTDEGILRNGSTFKEVSAFECEGITCLLFPMSNADLDIGKLAIWRLNTHPQFHGIWQSDFLFNKLGIDVEAPEPQIFSDLEMQ